MKYIKTYLEILLSIGLGVFLVWLLLKSTSWKEVTSSMHQAESGWLLLSSCAIMLSFPARTIRWGYIVRAAMPVSFRSLFTATQIGYMVDFILPMRFGEMFRPYVLSKRENISLSKAVALSALDRLTDFIVVIAMLLTSFIAYPMQQDITIPKETFGLTKDYIVSAHFLRTSNTYMIVSLLSMMIILVAFCIWPATIIRWVDAVSAWFSSFFGKSPRIVQFIQIASNKLKRILADFSAGLAALKSPMAMFKAVLFSFVTVSCYVASCFLMFRAFHIHIPWYGPLMLQALIAVATAAPGTPGFIGQFHIPVIVSILLLLPDTPIPTTKAIAIWTYLVEFIPITIFGLICFIIERKAILEFRRVSEKL